MELLTVTASTARKINHAIYGGEQFESSDHFVSLSASLEDGEDVVKAHRELMLMCKELADTSVANEILKFQGGLPWTKVLELARKYRLKGAVEDLEEVEKMNRLQKALFNELKLAVRTKYESESN